MYSGRLRIVLGQAGDRTDIDSCKLPTDPSPVSPARAERVACENEEVQSVAIHVAIVPGLAIWLATLSRERALGREPENQRVDAQIVGDI